MTSRSSLLWVFLAAGLLFGLVWEFHPLSDASERLRRLPCTAPGIESHDIALAPAEQINFSKTTVVRRVAMVRGDCVILTVVDGTRNRHAIHDPSFCFRGAGWEISSRNRIPMKNGEALQVHLHKGEGTAEALDRFSDGASQFSSPLLFWWKTALRRLSLGKSGPEPVLVILASAGASLPDWQEVLRAWPDLQSL